MSAPDPGRRERSRSAERLWILGLAAAILVITAAWFLIEKAQSYTALPTPRFSDTGLFLFLWVSNWLLILVLVVLILRNLTKLFLEWRSGVLGSRFKAKLVLAFTALCLLPSVLLMAGAIKVIEWSVDRWFSLEADRMTEQAYDTWEELRKVWGERTLGFARDVSRDLPSRTVTSRVRLLPRLEEARETRRLEGLGVFYKDGRSPVLVRREGFDDGDLSGAGQDFLREVLGGEEKFHYEEARTGFVVWAGVPLPGRGGSDGPGAVVAAQFLPRQVLGQAQELARTAVEYRQTKVRKPEIKTIFILLFVLFTLLTVFAAVWIGLTVARSITEPVEALTAGTREVQAGNLQVEVSTRARDELAILVSSFNEMVGQLRRQKEEIETANEDLRLASEEAARRSQTIETLLRNLTTAVLSLDRSGRVSLANPAFYRLLRLPANADGTGLDYRELLSLKGHEPLREAIAESLEESRLFLSRELDLDVGPRTLHVSASFAALRDGRSEVVGLLVVLDDLTDLIRAQRVAAWREVARRMAHEIKNPLTPIQLSAQRIQKAYREESDDFPRILEDGTGVVIEEVEALRRFLDEFSRFARLPASTPVPTDLREVVRSSVKLYEGDERARIELDLQEVPQVPLDPEQMRRVLGNLIDNALEVQNGKGGITIRTSFLKDLQAVRLEVEDDGPGVPPELRDRLFVPYFTTKQNGSGLGLAIVNRIVLDHNGRIRVEDREPHGSRFVVEIPA